MAGRSGEITVWGADAPFPANGFNMAGLGWDVVVVYEYPSVDLAAGHVGKQITVQNGVCRCTSRAASRHHQHGGNRAPPSPTPTMCRWA